MTTRNWFIMRVLFPRVLSFLWLVFKGFSCIRIWSDQWGWFFFEFLCFFFFKALNKKKTHWKSVLSSHYSSRVENLFFSVQILTEQPLNTGIEEQSKTKQNTTSSSNDSIKSDVRSFHPASPHVHRFDQDQSFHRYCVQTTNDHRPFDREDFLILWCFQ